jgi:DNA polymerase-3 subunit epsilon
MFRAAFERDDKKERAVGRFPQLFTPDRSGEVVALDTETTTLDRREAELVSIGAVVIRGNRILASRRLELVVRPRRAVSAASVRVHRLRPIDAAAGVPAEAALQQLIDFIGARPLVGYYLEFDLGVINRALYDWAEVTLPNRAIEVSALYYDWKLGRSVFLRQYGDVDLRFETIRRDLGLPPFGRHDAVSDAVGAALMYLKLMRLRDRSARAER